MHVRREELLMLLDRAPVDRRVADHVQQCAQCAAEIATMERTRDALRALPPLQPPPQAWARVRAAMSEESKQPRTTRMRSRAVALASAAGIAAVAVAITSMIVRSDPPNGAHESEPRVAVARLEPDGMHAQVRNDLAALMQQSRELEAALQALPARPHVERVSMAATLDTIEARIQWLDSQLTYAGEELDEAQAQRLWSERVELMDSLVKVRYAQTGQAVF